MNKTQAYVGMYGCMIMAAIHENRVVSAVFIVMMLAHLVALLRSKA